MISHLHVFQCPVKDLARPCLVLTNLLPPDATAGVSRRRPARSPRPVVTNRKWGSCSARSNATPSETSRMPTRSVESPQACRGGRRPASAAVPLRRGNAGARFARRRKSRYLLSRLATERSHGRTLRAVVRIRRGRAPYAPDQCSRRRGGCGDWRCFTGSDRLRHAETAKDVRC